MLRLQAFFGVAPSFKEARDFQAESEREQSVSEGINQRPSVQPPEASTN